MINNSTTIQCSLLCIIFTVLRILAAAMEKSAMASGSDDPTKTADGQDEFYNTSRVGRRNAMPDILGNHNLTTSAADLPDQLSALTTNDGASGSSTSAAGTSTTASSTNPTASTSASAS